jgi:DNA-binding transcriptional MerR regulator
MRYQMADLIARTGFSARTIRDYIRKGFLAPPTGMGPAALYDEEQMLRLTAAARMREEKIDLGTLGTRLKSWSLAEIAEYVRATAPRIAEPETPAISSAPTAEEQPPAPAAEMRAAPNDDLPPGSRYVLAPLLPGLALVVGEDASPLVRRVAREIIERYSAKA